MGFKSIHGIMPISIPKASAAAIASLKLALFGGQLTYQIPADEMNRIGTATGISGRKFIYSLQFIRIAIGY
jgi:muramoyltetrapeptide carboxypeptidase